VAENLGKFVIFYRAYYLFSGPPNGSKKFYDVQGTIIVNVLDRIIENQGPQPAPRAGHMNSD